MLELRIMMQEVVVFGTKHLTNYFGRGLQVLRYNNLKFHASGIRRTFALCAPQRIDFKSYWGWVYRSPSRQWRQNISSVALSTISWSLIPILFPAWTSWMEIYIVDFVSFQRLCKDLWLLVMKMKETHDMQGILPCFYWMKVKYITYNNCTSIRTTLNIIHIFHGSVMRWFVHPELENEINHVSHRCNLFHSGCKKQIGYRIWKLAPGEMICPDQDEEALNTTIWQTSCNWFNSRKFFYLSQ